MQPDLPTAAPPAKAPLAYGDLTFDVSGFRASLRGRALDLTPTEFRLLLELTRAPGVALSYSNLVQSACGYTCARHEAREIIGAHVLNLRKKLGVAPETALYIESVRGVSYRLIPAAE